MAMRHSTAIYLLEGFDPRELTPRQKDALDNHLAACSACASRASMTPSLQDLLAPAAAREIPGFDQALDTVRQSTLRAVRQDASRGVSLIEWVRRSAWSPLAVPVAALAGAVLVGLVLRLPATGESRPVPSQPALQAQASSGATPAVAQEPDRVTSTVTTAEVSHRAEAHRPGRETRPAVAQTASFDVVRSGSAVKIEWSQMGQFHRVRKAQDPQQVQLAGRQLVHGSTWSDAADGQTPGSVTYYLVD
jgi:hypothetical protein